MRKFDRFYRFLSSTLAFVFIFGNISASNLTVQPVIFRPTSIPLSADDLINPMRGYYTWRGDSTVPQPGPANDEYERYLWFDPQNPQDSLETQQGQYNFAKIDADIAAAASRGHKFAFRIRAMSASDSGQRNVPDYMANCGWNSQGTFIPDWNAACFLDNAQKLLAALGAHYDHDQRIAWIDIGIYGTWGEWALDDKIYASAPTEFSAASDASLNRIVDMHVSAFPDQRLVMMAKTRSSAVIHALSASDQIGWRVDCFGRDGYFDFPTNKNYQAAWGIMQNRWQTAPVIVEFCAGNINFLSQETLDVVQGYHIALIGNGNIGQWGRKSQQEQKNLLLIGKLAGYRFQIQAVTVPDNWTPGESVTIITDWLNMGATPYYEKAVVYFKLFDPANAVTVWEMKSSADLQKLLPTNAVPMTVSDHVTVPGYLHPGIYQLRIVVKDPSGFRKPLNLAITRRQRDGSYLLGYLVVEQGD